MELQDPAGQENQDFPLGDDLRPQRNLDKVLEDQLAVVLEASGKSHVGYPVGESTNLVPGKAIVEE